MHTKAHRTAMATAATGVIAAALATSIPTMATGQARDDHVEAADTTWNVDQVRQMVELVSKIENPKITVLVDKAGQRSGYEIAAEWLTANSDGATNEKLAVRPFAAMVPAIPDASFEMRANEATMPGEWKGLVFEAFAGAALKNVAAYVTAMAQAGMVQMHPMALGTAEIAALPHIDDRLAEKLRNTPFVLKRVPALVQSTDADMTDNSFTLERVAITKGREGKLYVGETEVATGKAKELLAAAGWEQATIECVTVPVPKEGCWTGETRMAHGEVMGHSPEPFVDWYEKTFPSEQETWFEKLIAPRVL